jgi:hypothetical protein
MSDGPDGRDGPGRVVDARAREPSRPAAAPLVRAVLRTGAKAALARWVLHKRRALGHPREGDGPSWPAPQDEATHAWDGRRRFAEDYTFVAVQPRLGVVVRLEWLPGRESHRLWVTLLREVDGRPVALALPGGQIVRRDERGDRWRAAGMAIDCIKPLVRWDVRYAGRVVPIAGAIHGRAADGAGIRCSLDLSFLAEGATFTPGSDDDPDLIARHLGEATWDAHLLQSVRRVQNRGYVQLGRIEGTVAIGDELVPVRAAAWRGHAWGVRDWAAADRAYQCFFVRGDGTRGWIHHARFPFVTLEGGFVDRSGQRDPVRDIAASFERRPDRAPARATVELGTGRTPHDPIAVELEMRSDLAFAVDGRGLVELGLFASDGGWGMWGGQRRTLPRPP